MNNNKKGFMFTLVTIFLISIFVFVLYASTSNVILEQQEANAERTEALVVNLFAQALIEEYVDSMVQVAAANSIRAMIAYINSTGNALDNPQGFYREVIMNGTIASTYNMSSFPKDFAMTLIAANRSDEITLASIETKSTTAPFGDSSTLVQRISLSEDYDALEHLKSVTLSITNVSASSGALYLVVYNATYDVVSMDILQYETGVEVYTFTFGRTLPLSQDTYYDIMLAAPFTDTNTDYEVSIVSNKEFECASASCQLAVWDLKGKSENVRVLLDFFLDKQYIGEGFLRALTGSFSALGKEHFAIDTEINVTDISIDETGPWSIEVNASFVVSMHKITVSFSDILAFGSGEISIIGLHDPYSILRSDILADDGRYFAIASQNVSDDFNEEDMARHIREHTFVFNENAPSFLERFREKNAEGSTCCGIQAVYQADHIFRAVEEDDTGYSFVDYMFQESTQCNADGVTDPLYYPYSTSGELSTVISSEKPWFDYASIEFYHMDEMSDVAILQTNCPTASESS